MNLLLLNATRILLQHPATLAALEWVQTRCRDEAIAILEPAQALSHHNCQE